MGKKTDLAVNHRRKATSGAATAYMSRNQALKKLQLRLADFRRICILKGIYPHEPRHPKKAGGATGSTVSKTYYYAKDINFLLHEPIVNKFREYKVHARKLRRAIGKSEYGLADRLKESKPHYTLDAIIRERFPTFIDAVRYLPDCLDMSFAYATMPAGRRTPADKVALCRRLTVEFMLYVITSRSLRKVFVSIKGFYFEADICGEPVRWRVPHARAYERPQDVDFRIIGTHVELYCPLLGFINFRLFALAGLHYPPLPAVQNVPDDGSATAEMDDRIAALTLPLRSQVEDDEAEVDDFPVGGTSVVERQKAEQEETKRIENLFGEFKFFLQREIDREQLTFVIRSCGGAVSWDRTLGPGSTYQESDERITHQIVDRGAHPTKPRVVSRYYLQPQWVFDCVNAKRLVPPEQYFPGVQLPPHLSPFVEEAPGEYVPPEKMQLDTPFSMAKQKSDSESEASDDDELESDTEVREVETDENLSSDNSEQTDEDVKVAKRSTQNAGTVETLSKRQMKMKEKEMKRLSSAERKKSAVTPGKVQSGDAVHVKEHTEREEKRLAEMMIPKKKQRLYRKIMYSKKKTAQEARILAEKRRQHDRKQKHKQKKLSTITS